MFQFLEGSAYIYIPKYNISEYVTLKKNLYKNWRFQQKIQNICGFIVECYIQGWISAPNHWNIIIAPVNGMFLKKLLSYNKLVKVAPKNSKTTYDI